MADIHFSTKQIPFVSERYSVHTPFPIPEKLLCYFVSFLANEKVKPTSIKTYLLAVRSMQISCLQNHSLHTMLKRVQMGIRRFHPMHKGGPKWVRLPITVAVLENIRCQWECRRHPERHVLWEWSPFVSVGSSGWVNHCH